MSSHSNSPSIKQFVYFPHEGEDQQQKRNEGQGGRSISNGILDKLLSAVGREGTEGEDPKSMGT